ncbi:MAG: hypothetical protein ABSF83_10695 [Nitrososphaerales archaeon]|jgi:DhnA family fructose-bisphosphate aldolase class Ia
MARPRFDPFETLPARVYNKITDIRVDDPDVPKREARRRIRRDALTGDGKLVLLAADHPGRMTITIRDDPLRMGRRHELLSRIVRVLADSPFDGLLGTADIIDELLMISHVSARAAPAHFLNKKVVIGSVNRGGLSGSAFELDDQPTGYDVDGIVSMNLDGAKFLLRIDLADRDSAETLAYCVQTVAECNRQSLPVFVEPLPVVVQDRRRKVDPDPQKLIRLVGAASALGSSSTRIWLKLPYTERFDEVAAATTLPILILGGEASNDTAQLLREVAGAMKAGPNVRGVLLGRNVLYPPEDDPLPVALAVHAIVHDGLSADEAESSLGRWERMVARPPRAND